MADLEDTEDEKMYENMEKPEIRNVRGTSMIKVVSEDTWEEREDQNVLDSKA